MTLIFDRSYNPGFPVEWEGLGFELAEACTPKWYGVSTGNGNDGVSHMWPDYYVRTCEPWVIVTAATLAAFKGEFWGNILENMRVDGEAEYTISVCIDNPDDVDPREAPDSVYLNSYVCPECGHAWECEGDIDQLMDCVKCDCAQIDPDESEEQERDGDDLWVNSNGCYFICEVFPIDDMDSECSRAWRYDSIEEGFTDNLLKLAREVH